MVTCSDSCTVWENLYIHFMGEEVEGLDLIHVIWGKAWKPRALCEPQCLYLNPHTS